MGDEHCNVKAETLWIQKACICRFNLCVGKDQMKMPRYGIDFEKIACFMNVIFIKNNI